MTSARLLCLPLMMLALVACGDGGDAPELDDARAPTVVDTRAGAYEDPSTPVVSPPQPAPVVPANNFARFDGYGDLRFGMTAAQARASWGGELVGDVAADGCGFLAPGWAANAGEFGLMFKRGQLVRYDVGTTGVPAPDGGRVGMTAPQIAELYPRLVEQPHAYVAGGRYLRVAHPEARTALLFETDASGRVTRWRVGLEPQVDYTEGCA